MRLTRRDFLAALAAAHAVSAADTPSIPFPTAPRERLAVSSYPFRASIDSPRTRARNPQAALMDLKEFPRMVIERLNIRNVELLGEHIRAADSAYVAELRAAVKSAGSRVVNIPTGVAASVYDPDAERRATAIANAKKWIDTAVALDCPSVRIHVQRAQGASPDAALASESLGSIAQYGASKNVMVNLENDDVITEDAFFIAKVIDSVNSPWLRALPDFCNSMLKGDEKFNYNAMAEMFRRAYNICHVKDMEVDHDKIFRIDIARTFAMAKSAKYRGYYSMEFEGQGDPWDGTRKLIEQSLANLA